MVVGYFWVEYSERVDRLLSGEVYTRSAGVYSAPKTLRDGEKISAEELLKYLKSAGYVDNQRQASETRSRYSFNGNAMTIEPGANAMVDDRKRFPSLIVKFAKEGKSIESIVDGLSKNPLKQALLEPKILSSIAAEGDGRRKVVTFHDIPQELVKAITITEDRAFFEHYGVNLRGIARAVWRRYEGDENSPLSNQGGSSITQQLVKNLLLSPEKSLQRKAQEAFMSLILETRLSKEEIFTLYANQIYLGQQAGVSIYGVGEAANSYFGKDVSGMSLSEAAFVAGIIRSPNRYNPYKNLEKVTERRNQVLTSMLEVGAISPEEFENAKSQELKLVATQNREELTDMPYFTQYAQQEFSKIVSDPDALQHLRVYTTIDPDLQRVAYEAVVRRLDKLEKLFPKKQKGNLQASLVAIKPKTGEIVAMIGGRDFQQNQFNRATDAMRQPGSVFKPFVYATAINSAYDSSGRILTAATTFKDEKKVFNFNQDTYSPNNYGDVFSNKELTLRDALVKSKNVITVDLAMELNIGKVMNLAAKSGLSKVERSFPSMALGTAEATPLQVATAYGVFANLGDRVNPISISRITNGEGTTVASPIAERKNVLRPDVAYILDDMMKDVINRGTAADAQSWGFKNIAGKQAFAGKTGTSRDGWFAGFTPEIVCVVYVGFDDGDDLGLKGSDSALPIWADFMREALNLHPEWNGDWVMPESIQKAEIDIRDGKVLREIPNTTPLPNKAKNDLQGKNVNGSLVEEAPEVPVIDAFITDVPEEFRRIEFFIQGTIPNKILDVPENGLDENSPRETPTPFKTWQEVQDSAPSQKPEPSSNVVGERIETDRSVTVMVCNLTGMRATQNCPEKEAKTFAEGTEPKEFCTFHVNPPK